MSEMLIRAQITGLPGASSSSYSATTGRDSVFESAPRSLSLPYAASGSTGTSSIEHAIRTTSCSPPACTPLAKYCSVGTESSVNFELPMLTVEARSRSFASSLVRTTCARGYLSKSSDAALSCASTLNPPMSPVPMRWIV
eukprot:3216906-Prymnesium_polylepis.2